MKTLGVIGGLGPMATAYFMQLVIDMTDAGTDQEHIPMIVYHSPQIPDRTSYLLGKSKENPWPYIMDCGKKLEQAGAERIAIPCITAHTQFHEIQENVSIPVLNIIKETAEYLSKEHIHRVGLEATEGTIQSQMFQKELEQQGIEVILPTAPKQEMITHIIYDNIKAGKRVDMDYFRQVEQEFYKNKAEIIILGCTELSMIHRDECIGHGYLDAMEVLARTSVLQCGTLKKEYHCLLT